MVISFFHRRLLFYFFIFRLRDTCRKYKYNKNVKGEFVFFSSSKVHVTLLEKASYEIYPWYQKCNLKEICNKLEQSIYRNYLEEIFILVPWKFVKAQVHATRVNQRYFWGVPAYLSRGLSSRGRFNTRVLEAHNIEWHGVRRRSESRRYMQIAPCLETLDVGLA